jgi:hypothetical protein
LAVTPPRTSSTHPRAACGCLSSRPESVPYTVINSNLCPWACDEASQPRHTVDGTAAVGGWARNHSQHPGGDVCTAYLASRATHRGEKSIPTPPRPAKAAIAPGRVGKARMREAHCEWGAPNLREHCCSTPRRTRGPVRPSPWVAVARHPPTARHGTRPQCLTSVNAPLCGQNYSCVGGYTVKRQVYKHCTPAGCPAGGGGWPGALQEGSTLDTRTQTVLALAQPHHTCVHRTTHAADGRQWVLFGQ